MYHYYWLLFILKVKGGDIPYLYRIAKMHWLTCNSCWGECPGPQLCRCAACVSFLHWKNRDRCSQAEAKGTYKFKQYCRQGHKRMSSDHIRNSRSHWWHSKAGTDTDARHPRSRAQWSAAQSPPKLQWMRRMQRKRKRSAFSLTMLRKNSRQWPLLCASGAKI